MDIVNDYLQKQKSMKGGFAAAVIPAIKCKDGFIMSVQASEGHYCYPRSDDALWTEVEVGFPSQEESMLMKYAEDPERPTKTVYAWVPVEIVEQIIVKHGGL